MILPPSYPSQLFVLPAASLRDLLECGIQDSRSRNGVIKGRSAARLVAKSSLIGGIKAVLRGGQGDGARGEKRGDVGRSDR